MNAPAPERKAIPLTADQYATFLRTRPEEERWQLIDGAAIMMPPSILRHQRIGANLLRLLSDALDRTCPELAVLYESGLRIEGFPAFLPVPDLLLSTSRSGKDHMRTASISLPRYSRTPTRRSIFP